MNGTQGTQSLPQGMGQGGNFPQGGPAGGMRGLPGGPGGPGGRMPLGGPFASIGMTALLVVTLIVLAVSFWQILRKAGFTPALGLLMLVPVVNLGVALWVAFTEWPVLREIERVKLVAASTGAVPAASVLPGTVSGAAESPSAPPRPADA